MVNLSQTSGLVTAGLAESQMIGHVLMAAAVALLAGVMLINVRRRQRRLGRSAEDPRERLERDRQVGRMGGEIRQMMVELEALTRRFSAQLDAKAIRLEKLLAEADRKIAQLEGRSPVASNGRQPQAGEAPQREPAERQDPEDPLTRRIYELADAGQTTVDIARQLDQQVGTVELILALRQQETS